MLGPFCIVSRLIETSHDTGMDTGFYIPKHKCLIEKSRQNKNANLWKFSVIVTHSNEMNSNVCGEFAFN